jgi:hypothetical protein
VRKALPGELVEGADVEPHHRLDVAGVAVRENLLDPLPVQARRAASRAFIAR